MILIKAIEMVKDLQFKLYVVLANALAEVDKVFLLIVRARFHALRESSIAYRKIFVQDSRIFLPQLLALGDFQPRLSIIDQIAQQGNCENAALI